MVKRPHASGERPRRSSSVCMRASPITSQNRPCNGNSNTSLDAMCPGPMWVRVAANLGLELLLRGTVGICHFQRRHVPRGPDRLAAAHLRQKHPPELRERDNSPNRHSSATPFARGGRNNRHRQRHQRCCKCERWEHGESIWWMFVKKSLQQQEPLLCSRQPKTSCLQGV